LKTTGQGAGGFPCLRGTTDRVVAWLERTRGVDPPLVGRDSVSTDDIKSIALPALRHRCLLNFEAEAEGIATDTVIQNIIETTVADARVAV
jgi:MoxR-like ATPase